MPIISKFSDTVIKIHYEDHNPPHFHAEYQGFEAVYEIKTSKKMQGIFPLEQNNLVMLWAKKCKNELSPAWELIQKEKRAKKIKGLVNK